MGESSEIGAADTLEALVAALKSSSLNIRLEALRRLQHNIQCSGKAKTSHAMEYVLTFYIDETQSTEPSLILPALLATYPRYSDRKSRRAVQSCIRAYLTASAFADATYPTITRFLVQESQKSAIAPGNAFVLLEWCCLVQQEIRRNEKLFEQCFGKLCLAAARLLDKCEDKAVRGGVQNSALTIARRGLRDNFKTTQAGEQALQYALQEVASPSDANATHGPYLGVVAGVSARIPERKSQLEDSKKQILDFYIKCIIGSKVSAPLHECMGLRDFFLDFVSTQDVAEVLIPNVEKAILRSPEAILQGPIEALAWCLPPALDISDLVSARLVKPLLSATNSANATIRDGAGKALEALVGRGGSPEALQKIAADLGSSMRASKAGSFELRGILSGVLMNIAPDFKTSLVVAQSIVPAASKEANDGALRKELMALAPHLQVIIASSTIDKALAELILKGCADKRLLVRKLWILCLADVLKHLKTVPAEGASREFVKSSLKVLKDAHDEIAASPLPATQNGWVAAGYGLLALLEAPISETDEFKLNKYDDLRQHALSVQPKLSFLLNSKVYTRLTSPEDCQWALYALANLATYLENAPNEAKTAWARAVLHLMLAPEVESTVRKETGIALSQAYSRSPASVGQSVVLGIWDVLSYRALEITKSPGEFLNDNRLLQAIKCIVLPKEKLESVSAEAAVRVLKKQAVSTVVLLRSELIVNSDWIATCLSMGIDPGQLVTEMLEALLSEILSHFELDKFAPLNTFEKAACYAAATLAFVAADPTMPALIDQFRRDLDPVQLHGVGPTEAIIARAPEGSMVVDVLGPQANGAVENKNQKDYDILKWEEEMRAQLAKKKGAPQKKLTVEQQAKVDAQLSHETRTRAKVRSLSSKIRRGAKFIEGLAQGPPTDAGLWMSPAISALIRALEEGAALIVDDEIVSAYLACSDKVSDRLGNMRPFVGVAALRSLHNANVPEHLCMEPLAELGTRVLYRLRFAAEQRPFDTATTAYAVPLTFSVLEHGKVGDVAREDADAQVLLALEFLSFQMGSCADKQLPRGDILRHLISAMQKYNQHYRVIRDCLSELCRSISKNITIEERDILLSAVVVAEPNVRSAVLQAIHSDIDLSDIDCSVPLWIACQDEEDDNAEIALAIWEEHEFAITDDLIDSLPEYLFSSARSTRTSAAKALAQALLQIPSKTDSLLTSLEESYRTEAQPLVPKRSKFGIVQRGDLVDQWEKRSGLALAFKEFSSILSAGALLPFMTFLVSDGALSDRSAVVRSEMVEAGTSLVAARGKECLEPLMRLFEGVLQGPDKGTQEGDWVNEAVIVLYGSQARHLPGGDKRTGNVIQKLLDTLSSPSESVQYAVANCLPPLVRPSGLEAAPYITSLLEQLFQSKKYAARRGAAYGLAGIVKGKGVAALRQYRVITALRSATEDKKSPDKRQGAMMAYELFSLLLGRTFEPYVIEILPQLLTCFGDPVASVRDACLDTAKTCFASLSSFGVSRVLPQLLEGLDETQWRSKKGACDLLGAMAYLDPQQLATSLPEIIPGLTAVLTDSHKEVRAAANSSLRRFGEVITNPEVKSLVDVLLKALSDPTKYTDEALDGLIRVNFVHYLDAPSLALVVKIMERGLNDRSSTKRKAAQIIGSLAHLTEKRDIVTHLPILVAGLRAAAIDPVPATRATGSKALGSLVEKLGEDAFPDLIPSLMSSLRTDTGASDRLGSAQALSEVLAGLGTGRLEETLPSILQNVASARATVREGFMTLFIFLPACFGNSFANYLAQIIPSILSGLADDVEAIRETALRAGRLLVKNFAAKAIDLLLPELQRGLADDSYRIRLSSVRACWRPALQSYGYQRLN